MLSVDMLQQFRSPQTPVEQGPLPVPDLTWGTQAQRRPLRFGGKTIAPDDPMYQLIQQIMLQQLMPQNPQVQGAQG